MAAGSTYTPIATTTLGSATSSYTFSSIPSTYTDIVLVVSVNRSTSGVDAIKVRINGDTGSNYSMTRLVNGSSDRTTGATYFDAPAFVDGSNTSNMIAHFMNYKSTSINKTILIRGNTATFATAATVGLWRSTAAINSIEVFVSTMDTGTQLTIYGIAAA